ncbi:MAG: tyrosine-protein phosphatase [Clostridia bacterium]|nr:tyrosine-protein phosphatase [Clostridia bacterium]
MKNTFTLTTTAGQVIENGASVCLVPEPIRRYMTLTEFTPETLGAYCDWSAENYYPVEITARVTGQVADGTVLYLTGPDVPTRTYPLSDDGTCTITNLLCGRTYFASLASPEDAPMSEPIRFTTEAEFPRTLRVPGTNNTRDIGGRLTADGKHRIRQGLVFRGATPRMMTPDELRVMTGDLGIRTELDVTGGGESSDAVAAVMSRELHSIKWYGLIFSCPESFDALRDAVKVFTKRENYPVYVHCSLGRDRTGAIAWILNGLCGVPLVDLCREHYLTMFSLRGDGENAGMAAHIANITGMTAGFFNEGQPGDSMQTCIEKFLRKIGVTDEDMDAIRSILLEDA